MPLLILLFLILGSLQSYSSELNKLYSSDTRFFIDLSGTWMLESDNEFISGQKKIPQFYTTGTQITYRKSITLDNKLLNNHTWQFYFMGIDDHIEIFINEQFVGKYFGGNTPFLVKIPSKLIYQAKNEIKLVVTPKEGLSSIIDSKSLFSKKNYTGILRDLYLIGTADIWISDLKAKSQVSGNNLQSKFNIKVSSGSLEDFSKKIKPTDSTSLNLVSNQVDLSFILRDPETGNAVYQSGSQSLKLEAERTLEAKFDVNCNSIKAWNIDNPKLYEVVVELKHNGKLIDNYITSTGFLTKSIKNNDIYINGKALEVKGITYTENPLTSFLAYTYLDYENDVIKIKNLGANVINVKYGTPHPYLVELCNRYGLLIMADLPIYDVPSALLTSDEIKVRIKNIAERLILAYDFYPSILAWGLYSNTNANQEIVTDFTTLIKKIFSKSNHKYIYATYNYNNSHRNELTDIDVFSDQPHRFNTDFVQKFINSIDAKKKPTIFSYGAIINPENKNGYSDRTSLEYQAFYIRNVYYILKNTELAGSMVNTFVDYELENPTLTLNNKDLYQSSVGLTDRSGRERLSFKILQTLYNNEKEPLLNAGSYSPSTPVIFIFIGLTLVFIIGFLLNRFKRFREYFLRSLTRPFNFYADIRDQRIMSTMQTFVLGICIAFTFGLMLSSVLYYYRQTESTQYLLMLLFPDKGVLENLFALIWMPEAFVFVLSIIFLALMFFIALLLKAFSFFIKGKIFFADTLTISIWSSVPVLFLLPVSIVLARLLAIDEKILFYTVVLFGGLMLWSLLRILKATSVVFEVNKGKVNLIGAMIMFLVIIFPVAYYHFKHSIVSYLVFYSETMLNF